MLSINEANKYFNSNEERTCKPTQYAIKYGAYVSSGGDCWWWLRSLGLRQADAAHVYYDGSVNTHGSIVDNSNHAVRPTIWVDISNIN